MNLCARLSRIEAKLEAKRPCPLIVRAKLPDAETAQEMTVQEMIETGAGFERVVNGNNLHDLDKILDCIKNSRITSGDSTF